VGCIEAVWGFEVDTYAQVLVGEREPLQAEHVNAEGLADVAVDDSNQPSAPQVEMAHSKV